MMDATAIKEIERLAIEASGQNLLSTHTPAIVIGNSIQSLEKFDEGRSRFRGKLSTNVLTEFAQYVKRNPGGEGFIDPNTFTASVIHNLGNVEAPGHADWTSNLTLEPTAPYAALLAMNGKPVGQKQLVEWIEDWYAHLSAKFGPEAEPVGITAALAAIRNLTISAKSDVTHTDKDFGASRSALEEIEAKAQGGIPTHLVFSCTPYLGFQPRDVALRLSVITGDKPALVLRIVSFESVKEELAVEFKRLVLEGVGDAATMTIGTFTP